MKPKFKLTFTHVSVSSVAIIAVAYIFVLFIGNALRIHTAEIAIVQTIGYKIIKCISEICFFYYCCKILSNYGLHFFGFCGDSRWHSNPFPTYPGTHMHCHSPVLGACWHLASKAHLLQMELICSSGSCGGSGGGSTQALLIRVNP